MALTFGGAISDRVVVAPVAAINTLATLTCWGWFKPTTLTTGRVLVGKSLTAGASAAGWFLVLDGTTGDLRFRVDRATDTDYRTNSAPIATTGKWYFIAATYAAAGAAGQRVNIYVGDESTMAVEATYGTATDGNSTQANDSAQSLIFANAASNAIAFQGLIGPGGLDDVVRTLAEVQALQFRPRALDSHCQVLLRLGDAGTGTQRDMSGHGNDGTVTGATVATDNPAIGPWRRKSSTWVPVTPAATFTPSDDPWSLGVPPLDLGAVSVW